MLLNLREQHCRHVLAIPPALGKIRQERIELARVMLAAAYDLGGNLSSAKLTDRPPVQFESPANGAQAQALSQQRVDFGMPFLSTGQRLGQLRETVALLKRMWGDEPEVTFEGKYVQAHNVVCEPKPARRPH